MQLNTSTEQMMRALAQPVCTGVLVTLTIKPDVPRERVMAEMPAEMRATAKLYLDGKIQQWHSLTDEPGVLFLFHCTTESEARELTDGLPLVREGLAEVTCRRLSPLIPLMLLGTD